MVTKATIHKDLRTEEITFWTFFGVTVMLSIGAIVVGILAVKENHLKIIQVNETLVQGDVIVQDQLRVAGNLIAQNSYTATNNSSYTGNLSSNSAAYHDSLAFQSKLVLGANNLPQTYNITLWGQVGLTASPVNLITTEANTLFNVDMSTLELKLLAGNIPPNSNFISLQTNPTEGTQSWFLTSGGGWLVTLLWQLTSSASNVTGTYNMRLIAYDQTLSRWENLDSAVNATELAVISSTATEMNGNLSAAIHTPNRNNFSFETKEVSLDRLGLQMDGTFDKVNTLSAATLTMSIYKVLPV